MIVALAARLETKGREPVVKPEWGTKRTCQSCGTAFYDMRRVPIVCPKCGTQFDPDVFSKARRSRPQPVEEKKAPPPKPEPAAEGAEIEIELPEGDEEFVEVEEEGGEEEDVIEDASELDAEDPVVGKVEKDEDSA